MDQTESKDQEVGHFGKGQETPDTTPSSERQGQSVVTMEAGVTPTGCGASRGGPVDNGMGRSMLQTPGAPTPSYVYALGRVEPRFPRLGVEKEFAQATGRATTAGLTDREALYAVLSKPENRYLSRQLCWVFTIEGLETYILHPTCFGDFNLLVEAVRPGPRPTDVDVVIGVQGAFGAAGDVQRPDGSHRGVRPDLFL